MRLILDLLRLARFRPGRVLLLLAVVLTLPLIAEAGWNIKQKGTGATVWENQDGETVTVGDSGLTVLLEDVSTASTAYVVTHRAGNIVKIYSVLFGAITTADATLDFAIISDGTTNAVSGGTGVTGATITIAFSGSASGDVDSITFTPGTDPAIAVSSGDVVTVHTAGGSTLDIDAVITIIIE